MITQQSKIEIYENGEYLKNNPSWHEEDSPWKARNILKIIQQNNLSPSHVCEVGCGVGEILYQLRQTMESGIKFSGYEISTAAYQLAVAKNRENLEFHLKDLLAEHDSVSFDILLVIDVIEHIEDYFSFLRKCKARAEYKVFHIPLDLSLQTIFRVNPILLNRQQVGHIHYFTKETALAALKDTGYEILDYFYTATAIDLPPKSIKARLAKWPRKLLFSLNKDITVRTLGGYSLMVLAK